MRVTFRGVRGSVPWTTPGVMVYGCNTPCLEVRDEDSGALLILDAGSGIVGCGERNLGAPCSVDILLSHYHWDHIQGLPFFAPFFVAGSTARIWAPRLAAWDGAALRRLFEAPFFPKSFDQLASAPAIATIEPGALQVGPFRVRAQPLAHPGGAFAYRVQGREGDLVYATDHEFGDAAVDDALAAFARNALAVVFDAHLTPDESPSHLGWGHSNWRQSADFASAVGAGHLWLFHHRPGRSDADIAAIEARARGVFPATTAAREGASFRM